MAIMRVTGILTVVLLGTAIGRMVYREQAHEKTANCPRSTRRNDDR